MHKACCLGGLEITLPAQVVSHPAQLVVDPLVAGRREQRPTESLSSYSAPGLTERQLDRSIMATGLGSRKEQEAGADGD